jgi:hypothetical protein
MDEYLERMKNKYEAIVFPSTTDEVIMTLETLTEILDKIKASSNTKVVEIYVDGDYPGYYNITSISSVDDGRVVINVGERMMDIRKE